MKKWIGILIGAVAALVIAFLMVVVFPWGVSRAARAVEKELGISQLITKVDAAVDSINAAAKNLQNPLASIDAVQITRITGLLKAAGIELDPEVSLSEADKEAIADAVAKKLGTSPVVEPDDPYTEPDPDPEEEVTDEEVVEKPLPVVERLAIARAKVDKALGRKAESTEETEEEEQE